MSELKEASEVLVFCSVLYRSDIWSQEQMECLLGEIGIHSDFKFIHHHESMNKYYHREMNGPLSRFFITDARLSPREQLVTLKLACDRLERLHQREGDRTFNFDPGIIALEHALLATGKPYAHRPYLGQGVYAELTFSWEGGFWKSFPWTYPDYADTPAREYFELMRCILARQLHP